MLILPVADFLSTLRLFVFASQMFPVLQQLPFCIRTLKLQRVELSRPPHIKDLRLFGEHMLCGWEQFANCGVINKTNKLCKDTDINHGAAGGRKSIFDCLSEFQFGRTTTERLSVCAEYTSGPVRSRVSGRLASSPQLQLYVWVSRDSSTPRSHLPHPVHTKPQNRLSPPASPDSQASRPRKV